MPLFRQHSAIVGLLLFLASIRNGNSSHYFNNIWIFQCREFASFCSYREHLEIHVIMDSCFAITIAVDDLSTFLSFDGEDGT